MTGLSVILTLWLAHRWPFKLAEKGKFTGKISRGAIWRALFWRTLWRLVLVCFTIAFLPTVGADSPEEAGERYGYVLILTLFFSVPYTAIRAYWVSRYFKLPDVSEEPPPIEGKEPAIYVFQNERKTGPFTKAQFKQMFEAGMVDARAKYWHAGMDGWKDVIPSP